eukprot:3941407-Rhodomonas_salina.2
MEEERARVDGRRNAAWESKGEGTRGVARTERRGGKREEGGAGGKGAREKRGGGERGGQEGGGRT